MQIHLDHLTKTYSGQVRAVRGVDLTIQPGLIGLLGPNGAGKTTLMRILATLLTPTEGTAHIGPYDVRSASDRRQIKRLLGYLPQELGLYPNLNAYEFLDYMAILKGMHDGAARKQRINDLLETVGLADVAKRRLKGFSGGMKRRVGLAQALLTDPQFLIVDEPTAGLDPEERIRIRTMLSELALARSRVIILSTHIVEDVAQTCRRLIVLHKGQVRFDGAPEELAALAEGRAWQMVSTTGARPDHLTVVSILPRANGIEYRVVGDPRPEDRAIPVSPGMEDGYLWLMAGIGAKDALLNSANTASLTRR
ncbi:MAG TPA: ABC transporter ATP-binding protein [Ktedonobacterales bacterium]|nr:ABC transporter ATP-binding protein [Ktedonobacterales bacterium]